MEVGTWRCARRTAARDVILGNGRDLAFDEVFFTADRLAGDETFSRQESVDRNAQGGVVVFSNPGMSLKRA